MRRLIYVVGTQFWPDGSKYEGQFDNDLRHGDGQHIWANQEVINIVNSLMIQTVKY